MYTGPKDHNLGKRASSNLVAGTIHIGGKGGAGWGPHRRIDYRQITWSGLRRHGFDPHSVDDDPYYMSLVRDGCAE